MSLQEILSFSAFLNKFREVERSMWFSYDRRKENDAEHSWQLSMLAWYVISQKKLPLSLEKVLQYCLIHDIPEIYAWDVAALRRSDEQQALKEERERQAMERIYHEFPQAHPMWDRVEQYEKREDEESKFVYALDKIIPVINIYNDWGFWWKENAINLEKELLPPKNTKVHVSPVIKEIWDELVVLLREQESSLFISK